MTPGLEGSTGADVGSHARWPARLSAAVFLIGLVGFISYWVRGVEPDPVAVILYGGSILPSGLVLAFDIDGEATRLGGRDRRRPLDRRRSFGRRAGAFAAGISAFIVLVGTCLAVGVLPFGAK